MTETHHMKELTERYNSDLFQYLDASPTAFHAVEELASMLSARGFIELHETEPWKLLKGKRYFVTRENCSLISFILGNEDKPSDGFRIIGSHADSPGLQLKPKSMVINDPYLQLGVEIYGGPLLNTWFDRDLSLAGRVSCSDGQGNLVEHLINFQRPLLSIPSLAIHLDREANEGRAIDKQKALPPVFAQTLDVNIPEFNQIIMAQIQQQNPGSVAEKVLAFDLFCYDPQKATYLGINDEFIASGRLDNLLSCHVAATAMANCNGKHNNFFICTNHEENGSTSTTGAQGSFAQDILSRIIPEPESQQISIRNSFFISIDNAHASHPNFKETAEPDHCTVLNGGPAIKINANQRYATNSRSAAVFKLLAQKADIEVQEFVMPTGKPCGSTIGPMTAAKLGVQTIDIGVPTFAMHSIREMTGASDPYKLLRVIQTFVDSPHMQKSK